LDIFGDLTGVMVTADALLTQRKFAKSSKELIFGITSKTPEQASAEQVLATNRGHWVIENGCHYIIDSIYDEDRSQIRTGYGSENMTRLRRFAISLLKSSGVKKHHSKNAPGGIQGENDF